MKKFDSILRMRKTLFMAMSAILVLSGSVYAVEVTYPHSGVVWTHGSSEGVYVTWAGAEYAVRISLYKGDELIEVLNDQGENDGYDDAFAPCDSSWGFGDDFRIKILVVDTYGNPEAWSDYFLIEDPTVPVESVSWSSVKAIFCTP